MGQRRSFGHRKGFGAFCSATLVFCGHFTPLETACGCRADPLLHRGHPLDGRQGLGVPPSLAPSSFLSVQFDLFQSFSGFCGLST